MNEGLISKRMEPDSAGVLGAAVSLLNACRQSKLDLSDVYQGWDQLMREVMRIAIRFEEWSCLYVDFGELGECWPYFLDDRFGPACLKVVFPTELRSFGEKECVRVAMNLELPVWVRDGVCVPVDVRARNPVEGSPFREFRIQAVREELRAGGIEAFQLGDDPFDVDYGSPFFALYGVTYEGVSEHVADRKLYAYAIELAQKLAPGIELPETPSVRLRASSSSTAGKGFD